MGYGKPSLKVGGKMFACLPSHKSAEPDSLVVRTDFEQRAELLSGDPNRHVQRSSPPAKEVLRYRTEIRLVVRGWRRGRNEQPAKLLLRPCCTQEW